MLGGAFCLAVTVRSGNQCSASRPDLPLDLQPTRAYPEPRWVLADGFSYAPRDQSPLIARPSGVRGHSR